MPRPTKRPCPWVDIECLLAASDEEMRKIGPGPKG
jgi:hypothetical protein